jgi:hypothetical protein
MNRSHRRVSSTPGSVIQTNVICIQCMARANGIPFPRQKNSHFFQDTWPHLRSHIDQGTILQNFLWRNKLERFIMKKTFQPVDKELN